MLNNSFIALFFNYFSSNKNEKINELEEVENVNNRVPTFSAYIGEYFKDLKFKKEFLVIVSERLRELSEDNILHLNPRDIFDEDFIKDEENQRVYVAVLKDIYYEDINDFNRTLLFRHIFTLKNYL